MSKTATILKTGAAALLLLTMSGCTSFIGEEPGQMDSVQSDDTVEQSRNAQLKTEAAALREALRQQREELERLNAGAAQ